MSISEAPEKYTIIDLRTPSLFELGHIEHAINIPFSNLLDPENLDLLKDGSVMHIFYGVKHSEANGARMLLTSYGYQNIKILEGGYKNFHESLAEGAHFDQEAALYDYASILQFETDQLAKQAEVQKPVPKPRKKIIPKKKIASPVEEEERC
jgi:rhodanese-related sulfurtransferase